VGHGHQLRLPIHLALCLGHRGQTRHHPILVPGSRDYGTVNLEVKHQARHFSVKIYPRLIHVIKSFNSHLQGGIPKTLRGVQSQAAAGLRMIHSLTGKDAMALGGFRIEVTVKAPSLAEAARLVRRTKFMDPRYWLGLGDGPHTNHRLSAKVVERKAFVDNANWVYQQAQLGGVFLGGQDTEPSWQQIQVLTDVFNALGWNNGLGTATKSMLPDAWWNSSPSSAPTLFGMLSRYYLLPDPRRDQGAVPAGPSQLGHRWAAVQEAARGPTPPVPSQQPAAVPDQVLSARLLPQAAEGGHHPPDRRARQHRGHRSRRPWPMKVVATQPFASVLRGQIGR